jgi:hypothetical protein
LHRPVRTGLSTGPDAGVVEGLWTINTNKEQQSWHPLKNLSLTQKGQKFFSKDWKLVTPAKREVVELTGISDALMVQNVKKADFKWRYVNLPEVVARYTGQSDALNDGKARFQLYDDGWRVLEFNVMETGRKPFVWTTSLEEEADRQFRVEQEAFRVAQEAERLRLEGIQRAKTPSRTIATYKTSCKATGGEYQLTITDATLMVKGFGGLPIQTIGYWEQLTLHPPDEWGNCIALDISAPDKGGFVSITHQFLADKENMETLRRAYERIIQAQKEWRQKYPDIH